MKKIIVFVAAIAFLGGCSLHTRSGSVVIDPHKSAKSSGGGFCPPGS